MLFRSKNKKYLLLIFLSSCVIAQQSENQSASASEKNTDLKKEVKSRSGYEVDGIGYGGRTSVGTSLYLDDIFVSEHLRFPEFDKSLQPYYEWKRKVRQQYNLQLGQDYTTLYQKASDSLTDTDSATAGVYRFFGRWLVTGKGTKNSGALVFKIDRKSVV